jgi:hypothetical protein
VQVKVLPDVWLYDSGRRNDIDEEHIAKLIAGRGVEEWDASGVRIKLYVDAHNFPEAFELGRQRLSEVLHITSYFLWI